MDNEIKDMMVKLLEGQNRLESKVSGIESKVNGIESKVSGLETETIKNSITLETIDGNIRTIVELQSGHKEQDEPCRSSGA